MHRPITINSPCQGLAQLDDEAVVPFVLAPEFTASAAAAKFDAAYFRNYPSVPRYARTGSLAEIRATRIKVPSPGEIDLIVVVIVNMALGWHCRDYFILPRNTEENQ